MGQRANSFGKFRCKRFLMVGVGQIRVSWGTKTTPPPPPVSNSLSMIDARQYTNQVTVQGLVCE